MFYLGIDIGGTKTAFGLVDESGTMQRQARLSSADVFYSSSDAVTSMANSLLTFLNEWNVPPEEVIGAVVGIPGIIDRETQTITSCPNLTVLDDLPLAIEASNMIGFPVFLENDVNLIAVGEHVYGRGRGISDMACIFVGTGIGCGLILNGKLYIGADGSAGEFGHTVVVPNGIPCTCGAQGCLEMYCSGKAISLLAEENHFQEKPTRIQKIDISALFMEEARQGNESIKEVLNKSFYYLGIGMANLVNLLNPRLIILGGGIINGWPEGLDVVRAVVGEIGRKNALPRLVFEYPSLGEQAALLGAAAYVRDMLNHPSRISK
jgi:glucokinase